MQAVERTSSGWNRSRSADQLLVGGCLVGVPTEVGHTQQRLHTRQELAPANQQNSGSSTADLQEYSHASPAAHSVQKPVRGSRTSSSLATSNLTILLGNTYRTC